MKKNSLIIACNIFCLLIMIFVMNACSKGGSIKSETPKETLTITGRVVDGPISGSIVFVDMNNDGKKNASEPSATSDEQGFFSISKAMDDPTGKKIIAAGGTDIITEVPMGKEILMSVISDDLSSAQITPLTTILAPLNTEQKKLNTLTALGINDLTVKDMLKTDFYKKSQDESDPQRETAISIQKTNQKTANLLRVAQSITSGKDTAAVISNKAIVEKISKEISKKIEASSGSQRFDLENSDHIKAVLRSTSTELTLDHGIALEINSNTLTEISTRVSDTNTKVSDLDLRNMDDEIVKAFLKNMNNLKDVIKSVVKDGRLVSDLSNKAPIDISLSLISEKENIGIGSVIGTLSNIDEVQPNIENTYTYTLLSHKETFEISGTNLKTKKILDGDYIVLIQVDDGVNTFSKKFIIDIMIENIAPTDISLFPYSVNENMPTGTLVGFLSNKDSLQPGIENIYTYTLLSNNENFEIIETELRTKKVFDFETITSFTLSIQVNDGVNSFSKPFIINIDNIIENIAPTDISLSPNSVNENMPIGTLVGTLSNTDAVQSGIVNTYTYTLLSNNENFEIIGTELRTKKVFDFETITSFTLSIQVNDGVNSFDKELPISIEDHNITQVATHSTNSFDFIAGITFDNNDKIYIAEYNTNKIKTIDESGNKTHFSGAGQPNDHTVENGASTVATFWGPYDIEFDGEHFYTIGRFSQKIRKIDANGNVTTLAGPISDLGASTDGTMTAIKIAVDSNKNVYASDILANKIQKIDSNGNVTELTLSGSENLHFPSGMAFDNADNLYVANVGNHKILKIDSNGNVSLFAGSGNPGSNDGQGNNASFNRPHDLAVDSNNNVYVADEYNNRIRKIDANGNVTTLAGSGTAGSTNGPGNTASFNHPSTIAVDSLGNVYVGEMIPNTLGIYRVRKITTLSD